MKNYLYYSKKILMRIFISILLTKSIQYAQSETQIDKYRNDNYGNKNESKIGIMDGNSIRTLFNNYGQIGFWSSNPSGEWPKGSKIDNLAGCSIFVTSEITAPGNSQIIHPVEITYTEYVDLDPLTNELWTFRPIPGYSNTEMNSPAMSNNNSTWPNKWPAALVGIDDTWGNDWYGYFGKNNFNPDLESFFVFDDSQDKEFTRFPYSFFPIKNDQNRGGMGIRVEARGLAWNIQEIENVIYWNYKITNISDYNYNKTFIGFFIHSLIGGYYDIYGDKTSYSEEDEIVYSFNSEINSATEIKPGYMGFAFFDTPTDSFNGSDDDDDGLIDESPNNSVDDDEDWQTFTDLNNNGIFDTGEPINNDIGSDGLGPQDSNYVSPDQGEGDGMPTLGEPNFELKDYEEYDRIGLSALKTNKVYSTGPDQLWPKNDDVIWSAVNSVGFDTTMQNGNIVFVMGTGPFGFNKGQNTDITLGYLFGSDLEDMLYNERNAQNMFINFAYSKNVSTSIPISFNNFPTNKILSEEISIGYDVQNYISQNLLVALYISSDGENYEYVDSRDKLNGAFIVNTNNYEDGIFYKFKLICFDENNSGEIITSDFLTINNSANVNPQLKFISPSGEQNKFSDICKISWLTGDADSDKFKINLYFTVPNLNGMNSLVENLSSNDSTFNWNTFNLPNSSNYQIIAKLITETDTIIVNSHNFTITNSRDIFSAEKFTLEKKSNGTGELYISVNDKYSLTKENYKIIFDLLEDSVSLAYHIINESNNIEVCPLTPLISGDESPLFEGLRIILVNDDRQMVIDSLSGWEIGSSNLNFKIDFYNKNMTKFKYDPSDYRLEFYDGVSYSTPFLTISSNMKLYNITEDRYSDYEIIDNDYDNTLSLNDEIIVIEDILKVNYCWRIYYKSPKNQAELSIFPVTGDKFKFVSTKPFLKGDAILFRTENLPVDINGISDKINNSYSLQQNYPNPFNPTTKIKYIIPQNVKGERTKVKITIFDILGKAVKTLVDEYQTAGNYEIEFDAGNLSSGIYFYKLQANEFISAKRMLLLK